MPYYHLQLVPPRTHFLGSALLKTFEKPSRGDGERSEGIRPRSNMWRRALPSKGDYISSGNEDLLTEREYR
ncbi:hypothetical protein SCLCIDRAFT_1210812 [Scleroderma citrinum Foug A]|uniref:Uncharacterized protein n=1 Tax=Scleroderma citrinum Foug A TaxID=1036808 RepID=A0A0C3E1V5_9AGAM|nr:hypothetical protein SCLCIDRAFT_1210812 [Scleroderma citrinum Foug A]